MANESLEEMTMKNISGNDRTSAPKKLTVADLKNVIGGLALPRDISAEDTAGNKVVIR